MIRKNHLPPDATIADVVADLEDAGEYLRRVLGNMRFCQKRHGDAHLRIGITGKRGPGQGLAPSYRIDYRTGPEAAEMTVYNGFGGRSHSAFTPVNVRETNWSRGHATIQEVQKLYDGLHKAERERAERDGSEPGTP
ncbi:MAG: hypothetical protein Q7T93_22080 [Methylobacterium sp.]|jgi:hypothetical protein|uniref:hypothetical protein n=1 Tax=unclassified Methylobacterium TaxID=2615210 RepID=UPI0006FFC1F5|nr:MULTISPECIES: hypothetical protein [unclassified Methylobacterium]KQP08440.1 hypothetical protein ASF28_20875 [Methylobacterium sp. Leaf99]MDO9429500.1 hypothetical protein [Methylobacterium sp.]TXM66014.1 hypothetical protein FV218_20775 [Methylobacterium sp. WL69]